MSKTLCVAATALLLTTMRISAHHSFAAEYDENKRVTVSGTVTGFNWTNPHAWLYVDGKDAGGRVATWGFEMGSPGGLIHRGWIKTALKKGDRVTVEGYGAKDGSNTANARTVTMPDGAKLFGGFHSTPGAPVSGVGGTSRSACNSIFGTDRRRSEGRRFCCRGRRSRLPPLARR
jgi:hypothetical protein